MSKIALYGGKRLINKKFDLGATYFKEEEKAVLSVIRSQTISGFVANNGPKFYGGKKVIELEEQFKNYFQTKYAVASNSATSSLHSALFAIGIQPGDEVIVPSVSMSASAAAILMCGGIPVFVDIKKGRCHDCSCEKKIELEKGCFNINTSLIEEKITAKTRAIIVVHLFGVSADMHSIQELASKHNLKIIEDCAQSPGTSYNNELVGTIGDIGVFSFNQSKTISAGEGGVAITNNYKYAIKLQLIRNHGEAMSESFPEAESNQMIGYNYRLTDLEAAVAVEQFKRLDKFNDRKIKLGNMLTKGLKKIEGLDTISIISGKENVIFIYPIIFNADKIKTSRKIFVKACNAEGVPMVEGYTKPLTRLKAFEQYIENKNEFIVADTLNDSELISLKICHHYNISRDDIELIIKAIKKVSFFFQSQ